MGRIRSGLGGAAAVLLLWAGAATGAQLPPAGAEGLDERLSALVALGPRPEGSAGEAAAFDFIAASLRRAGLEPASRGFSEVEEGYSKSRILEASLPGSRADELAIMVPVSSWPDSSGPVEGAYAIALALDQAARLEREAKAGSVLPISLSFVFVGAENRGKRSTGEAASLGSRSWIARRSDRSHLAVLYLSLDAEASRIAVRSAGRGVLSPFWYYEAARRALEASGVAVNLDANRLQAYRLGLASDYGPAAPYLEAGIPAIELRGEAGLQESRSETGARPVLSTGVERRWFGQFIDLFAKAESGGFGQSWDRHYFIVQIGKFSAVLRERLYVALLVASFALVSLSILAATVARRRIALRLLRRVPLVAAEILALFVALALVFLAGKGIARIDSIILGSSDSWKLFPRLFASARIAFSFLFFLSLLSFLVEKRVLTPNPHFYELAALVCLVVDSLVFSAADLSAAFYFIWALALVELSLAIRRRWATLAAYLLMYLPLLIIAAELGLRPDLHTYGQLIAPGYFGVLALSALTLPFFVFTASPLLFFAKPGAAARRRAVFVLAVSALAVEGFALGYAAIVAPLGGGKRRDLRISELIDQDRGRFRLELAGLRRLGGGAIEREGQRLKYFSLGDRAYLEGEDGKPRIGSSETTTPFLDRADKAVSLSFAEPPYSVDIALESSDEILIYDCNLPYRVAVDGRSAAIFAGINPGKRLDFTLTVPASFRSRLLVTARYLSSLGAYTQSSGALLSDSGLSVTASFEIGSESP